MTRTTLITLTALALLPGCWNTDATDLATAVVGFEPESGTAPAAWSVQSVDLALTCPDGQPARIYFVFPNEATGPVPTAVIYHSGAFDYVLEPGDDDPLAGPHFQPTTRMNSDWATRQVFVTLGMYPDIDPHEDHDGTLPALLANNGYAIALPANCWGDLWHNSIGEVDNVQFADGGVARDGRTLAEYAYRLVADPQFKPPGDAIVLPYEADNRDVVVIGLGNGSRAVGELISLDGVKGSPDGSPDFLPSRVLIDSPIDDPGAYYAHDELFSNVITGLDRIFEDSAEGTSVGSIAAAPLLPNTLVYAFSSGDGIVPDGANSAVLDRIANEAPGATTYESYERRHVLLNNASSAEDADRLVRALLNGR